MSITTYTMEMPAEHMQKIFGQNDRYVSKLETDFDVTIVDKNGSINVSQRGDDLEEQKVDYAITLGQQENEESLVEIDKELICHTISGKPIKPKTLGQKQYVEAIKNNMIVFGLGPAGTGKTYLAMAMAITAFKRDEVSRIILTRPTALI